MIHVRIARKALEAEGICSFELVAADGRVLPSFSAGSHIDVQVPGGLVRQYSLCNAPGDTSRYLIAVLKEPASRGGSKAMHEQLDIGDEIEISEPKNHFPLTHEAERSLLLAGGIGITPILCMAERLASIGANFELHYCTRSPARTAFLERITRSTFASRTRFHFDDGAPEQKMDLESLLATPRGDTHLYVCGPKGFIDAVLGVARRAGWKEDRLHCEFLSAQPLKSDEDRSFEVKLASSGRVIVVPSNKTAVQALADAGVEVPTSCEQGVCGTCLTRVLEGTPEHRDAFLTPDEQAANDQFTPCCSRAKSPCLVLDL